MSARETVADGLPLDGVAASEAVVAGEAQPAQGSDREQIAKAAAIIMVGTILSRVLGLGREQITSYLFGTGDTVAAFTIADNIHTMLFDLVMSGMMEAALVPVLSAYTTPERREELRRITGALLVLVLLVIGGAVLGMEVFAPVVVRVMTAFGGGAGARGAATVALTVQIVRVILPAVLLLAISAVTMSTLYSLHRFTRPALSVAARNAAIIFAAITLGRTALGVRSLAVGVVLGGLCLVLIQAPGLRDALPRPNLNFRHPAIRRIYGLYLPITLGLVSNTVALVVDRNLAWGAGVHALGAMRYATALNQMILGLVATATSIASLPTLARHFSRGDEDGYRRTLSNALKLVAIMVVPATLGMAAISWPAVRLLFAHGATDQGGAHAILIALLCYLPGTFFAAFDQVLIFAFYARHNTRTPVAVGVLAVGVYFAIALTTVHRFGMAGLVLANSAQFTFHAVVMWFLLRRTVGHVGDATVGRTLRRALLAGAVMATAVLGFSLAIGIAPGGGIALEFLNVALPVAAGALIYAAMLRLLGVEEMQVIQRGLLRKLGRG